jgi:hypothetical protein
MTNSNLHVITDECLDAFQTQYNVTDQWLPSPLNRWSSGGPAEESISDPLRSGPSAF